MNALKRMIHKTPTHNELNTTYNITEFNLELLEFYSTSPNNGEYVFSIEKLISINEARTFITTHPSFKLEEPVEIEGLRELNEKEITEFNFLLSKPSIYPLSLSNEQSILETLELYKKHLLHNEHLLVQILLCRRQDNWQEHLRQKYEDYLQGVDYPFESKALRSIQKNIILQLDKVSGLGFKRDNVEVMERKLDERGYRFECRAYIFSSNKNTAKRLYPALKEWGSTVAFYNHLEPSRQYSKVDINVPQERKFRKYSRLQLLSDSEIYSLFGYKPATTKERRTEIENTIRTNESSHTDFTLNPIYQLLPNGLKTKENDNIQEIINVFSNAFKELDYLDSEPLEILQTNIGAVFIKLTFKLPSGIKYSDIKNNVENIQSLTGIEFLEIEKGSEQQSFSFLLPKKKRSMIFLRDLVSTKDFQKHAKGSKLPFVIGVDEIGQPIYVDLRKIVHLLVAGSTGSGKSVFLVQLILTLLMALSPKQLHFYMIDPKRVELKKFKKFSHVKQIVHEAEDAIAILKALVKEMERRYEILDEADYDEIEEYNKNQSTEEQLPYIVAVIDEFADLIMINSSVKDYIVRLGQKARAAGIILICATQRPETKIVDGIIKANLPTKVSFRCSSTFDYRTVFGSSIPYNLLGNGDGVIKLEGANKEFIRFQGPLIHNDKEKSARAISDISTSDFIEEDESPGLELIYEDTSEGEGDLETLKRIIDETGETRIRELQKLMRKRISVVSSLMKELEKEGWLVKTSTGYKTFE